MSTPTPSLIIDLPTVKRNIVRLADYSREHKIAIRPHTKTHKSIRMAKLQLEAGAKGLTVAKVGEAITMTQASDDILVAYPALDPWRREHLAQLAKTCTVRVGIDSTDAADLIGHAASTAGTTVGVLVDLDVGHHRTGVQSPADALSLARHISKVKSLRFDGLMFYPGHLKHPASEQAKLIAPIEQIVRESLELLKRDGLEAKIISGGSTPAMLQSHLIPQQTEIRPGTYIFNDTSAISVAEGKITVDDCAARMTCTVISTAVPGKFVIDAGSKSLTQDRRTIDPDTFGFGHVIEFPDATIVRLTEEHGEVQLAPGSKPPKIGERVQVIPNHICPCVNLQTLVWVKDEAGNLEPLSIDARGQVW